jgi:hypothetical protein
MYDEFPSLKVFVVAMIGVVSVIRVVSVVAVISILNVLYFARMMIHIMLRNSRVVSRRDD